MKKDLTLYERTGEGELIPQEVKLELTDIDAKDHPELKDEKIRIIPMTRGELKAMFSLLGTDTDEKPETDRDEDAATVFKYCKAPEYTEDELVFMKPVIMRSIVRTIFINSGVKMGDSGSKKSMDNSDEFGKN